MGIEKLGALDLEGQFDYADEHYQILATVLAARGGIEAISLPGLGEKLNRIDIIKASINLERPSVSRRETPTRPLDLAELTKKVPLMQAI